MSKPSDKSEKRIGSSRKGVWDTPLEDLKYLNDEAVHHEEDEEVDDPEAYGGAESELKSKKTDDIAEEEISNVSDDLRRVTVSTSRKEKEETENEKKQEDKNGVETNANATEEDKEYDDYMVLDEEYQTQFRNNIESLSSFKYMIEALTRDFLTGEDLTEEMFMKEILGCNVPQFHNQVPKMLLFVTISAGEESTYAIVRQLLDNFCAKKIVSELQLLSAFRRLFHRVNEMVLSNPKAYDALVEFGEYCVDKGHLESAHLKDLIRQTEFARNNERVSRLKKHVKRIIEEYFSSADVKDAIKSVKEMGTRFYSFEVVKQIISTSMDRDNRCRELTCKFLSAAIGDGVDDAIDRQSAELGFTVLLQRVEDLYKDVPDVLHYLSCFVARCIADEVLAPSFLESVHLLETDMGYAVIFRAQNLLKGRHANKRLQNIWGVSSEKPVKELKTAISAIVREFLVNEDMNETIDNIRDLNVPLFSHEIVKQCIAAVTDYTPVNLDAPVSDSVRSRKAQLVAELLSTCVKNNIIPSEEIDRGFQRVRERINDLKLDSPQIAKYYNEIASKFKDVPLCQT